MEIFETLTGGDSAGGELRCEEIHELVEVGFKLILCCECKGT